MSKLHHSNIMLPEAARDALKHAAMSGTISVDLVVEQVRADYPDAFHSKASLRERGFAHQPKHGEPHRWWMHETIPAWADER